MLLDTHAQNKCLLVEKCSTTPSITIPVTVRAVLFLPEHKLVLTFCYAKTIIFGALTEPNHEQNWPPVKFLVSLYNSCSEPAGPSHPSRHLPRSVRAGALVDYRSCIFQQYYGSKLYGMYVF